MYVYFDVDERSLLRYMRQRGETPRIGSGQLRDEGLTVICSLPMRRIFRTKGKSTLPPAK